VTLTYAENSKDEGLLTLRAFRIAYGDLGLTCIVARRLTWYRGVTLAYFENLLMPNWFFMMSVKVTRGVHVPP
jgi:hypothetical protein